MKVLSFFTNEFSFTPGEKNHESASDSEPQAHYSGCITAFIQVEEDDEKLDVKSREKKLTNHLKWVARKNATHNIVLHSFAHLSSSKASIEFTKQIFDATQKRLENGGFTVAQTPFGCFLNLKMDAPGYSMARIWAEL
ncbi:threonyl-tRNA synthetase editing domain-containing protein [Natronoflexus pectinivorans]|uniref:Threonyl-tRNA synthetase editing subunit n=1 Tax=Natronoflexus pectinivorans TaxID=682526 RepID=A0A4R2GFR9_9BACT|nr:threonyl-tRNA synthetase editing domain-containing protein [Natronoflexus pectinivorans]TCO07073.1 threonyl-tRNA synthetase editing subunit [Natronoflexus pectinivorans]